LLKSFLYIVIHVNTENVEEYAVSLNNNNSLFVTRARRVQKKMNL